MSIRRDLIDSVPKTTLRTIPNLWRRVRDQRRYSSNVRRTQTAQTYKCHSCGVSPKGNHTCLFYTVSVSGLLSLLDLVSFELQERIWDAISMQHPSLRPTPTVEHARRKDKRKKPAPKSDNDEKDRPPAPPLHFDTSSQASPPSFYNYGIEDPLALSRTLQQTVNAVVGDSSDSSDWFAHAIEAMCIGAYGMYYSESTNSFVTHFAQMAHSIYGKSISLSILDMLGATGITNEHDDSDDPTWIIAVREMIENWESFVSSPLLETGLKVISLIASLGYCSLENLDISLNGIKLFSKIVVPEKVSLTDILSCGTAVLSLAVYQGYECFKYGTYSPLLYHEDKMIPILKKVSDCEKVHTYFELGNMQAASIDEIAFAALLKETRDELGVLAKTARSPVSKKLLMDKYLRIEQIDAQVQTRMTAGGLKVAPFTVGIFGGSSVGKTSVNNIVVATLLRALGASYRDKDRIRLNPLDKYASGAHNGLTAITFDELGQVKEKFLGENPAQMLFMQLGNNEVTPLNMAEAHLKGKVAPRPVIMSTTKNVKDNAARSILNEPLACVRREHYILTIVVRDQFCTNGFLDSAKIVAWYGRIPALPDAWQIRIEKVRAIEGKPLTSETNVIRSDFEYVVAEYNGKLMESVSIEETLEFLIEEAQAHHEIQKQIVSANTEIGCKIPFCDKHCKLYRTCGCTPPSIKSETTRTSVSSRDVSDLSDGTVITIEPRRSWFPWSTPVVPTLSVDREALRNLFTSTLDSEILTHADPSRHSAVMQGLRGTEVHSYSILPWRKKTRPSWQKFISPATIVSTIIVSKMQDLWEDDLDSLCTHSSKWVEWIPERWFEHPMVRDVLVDYHTSRWTRTLVWVPLFLIFFLNLKWSTSFFLFLVIGVSYRSIAKRVHAALVWKSIQYKHTNAGALARYVRQSHEPKVSKALMVLTILTGAAAVWKFMDYPVPWKNKGADAEEEEEEEDIKGTVPHGTLIPQNQADFDLKNDQKELMKCISTEHNWVNVARKEFEGTEQAWTTAREDLLSILKRNLLRMEWEDPITGGTSSVLILMVKANRGVTVGHFAPACDTKISFYRHEDRDSAVSSNFKCWIGPTSIKTFGQDCALVYVPKGGVFRDITSYFSDSEYTTPLAHLVWRDTNTPPTAAKAGNLHDETIVNRGGRINAIAYDLAFPPKPGMCGAPLVSEQPPRSILGIHQAGNADPYSKEGFATRVKKTALLEALADMEKDWFEPVSDGVLREKILNQSLIESPVLHPKSPLRTMEHGHFEYIGQCPGRATFNSTVHLMPSCRGIEEEFGIVNDWRAPNMKDPWGTTLNFIANASDGIEPEHLLWAQRDYQAQLLRIVDEHPEWIAQVRELTVVEAINGVDDVRFLDGMDLTTAAGIGGYKKLELLDLHVDDVTGRKWYTPKAELQTEIDYIESCFVRGERCWTPFKLVFKDEAVNKDKMRAFSVGQFAFSIVTRRHCGYLHWLFKQSIEYSECAVGMNPHGPEWEEWVSWHTEYTDQYIFDGDYSKFDLRQASMVKAGTAQSYIVMSRNCSNLSSHNTQMIRGIFTEKMYPLVAANGDLVVFYGYSPSGVSGTVEENSGDNCHILRSAAHKIKPVQTPRFRDVIKAGTYGDDVRGGVHPDHLWYNSPAVAAQLATWDFKFTPSDKSGDIFTAKWNPDGDFLKMRSGIVEGTDIRVGKLDPKSITKPLLAGTKSSLTNEAQVSVNINGAMRDAFAHGRSFYEDYRTKLTRVASRLDLLPWCSELSLSYDAAHDRWTKRYLGDEEN